ncbi:hypothetical protein [Methylobacterium gnaphalii]|uniref:Uncharacterized protein n=1 Tax=Methylobacterium gnaphalii TaxID=1010610 RepID=A0A512JH19_9HYPH|nr:hypothetical protein [Methylobacterium gnaphalii]GEP09267.1 hypothetical protein MGN01_11120 [Methylobacterium gnaphalii]GJD69047.1 hypothetical protein MMMDOFMJ_1973 [Methylobacterium gnaphalii]GLS51000.1 hypothetical protein GCM10007885_38540 [Methylobacterium gnaphalii]
MSQNPIYAQAPEGPGANLTHPHFERPGRDIERGFYIARRVSWVPNSGWTIVMVDDPQGDLRVFEPGAPKSDPIGKWVFGVRVSGFEHLPDYCSH